MEKNENFKSELENQYSILIKASEKREQKRYIVILSVLVITLISVICSVIISFLALNNSKNVNIMSNEKKITYYQTLSIKYNNTNSLSLSGIGNGYELATPKTIEITNDGTTDITFDIKLSSINTSLLSTNKLVYTLLRDNEIVASKELPLIDKVILDNIKISPNETISYVLKVEYIGVVEDNTNYYNSKIIIEQNSNKSNLLE